MTLCATITVTQKDVQALNDRIDQQIFEIKQQNTAVQMSPNNSIKSWRSDYQEYTPLVDQLNYQRATLEASRELMKNLLAQVSQFRQGQRVTGVEMSEGGEVYIGQSGSTNKKYHIKQEIHNVKATNGSKAMVGVFRGLNIDGFFKD